MNNETAKTTTKKGVISIRKSCGANGAGLSHYILMDGKATGK
jgi:modified peptide precursor CbpA